MKRISYNFAIKTIQDKTNSWLHLNSSSGGYQLEEYSHQYATQVKTLKTGTLREVFDYFQKLDKSKYDFLPKHCFPIENEKQLAEWSLTHFVDKLNKTVENFKLTHKAFFHISESELIQAFVSYCSFYELKVHDTSQTGTDHVFYNPAVYDSGLRPVNQPVADWRFNRKVKALTDSDKALYESLPESISDSVYSQSQKKFIQLLYSTYVEPVCAGIAGLYARTSDPYLTSNKQPTIVQAMHQTVRWVIDFLEKGELTNQQASGFFFAHLDSTEALRVFIQHFYTTED